MVHPDQITFSFLLATAYIVWYNNKNIIIIDADMMCNV